jgi:chromosome partitioning protein
MIITFGTQKGGVGKTTLAIAFANYISLYTDKKIYVIDYDYQKSFYQKWGDDKEISGDYLYEVTILNKEDEKDFENPEVMNAMKISREIYLIDIPGNIDKKYTSVLRYSDYIIIPFSYSDITVNSTMVFINLCGLFKLSAKLFFIRNHVDKLGKYRNQIDMDIELSKHGSLMGNSVYKRNCLQTITTKGLSKEQLLAVKNVFDELIYNIYGNT